MERRINLPADTASVSAAFRYADSAGVPDQ
jgi:hypothetical protein